MTAESAPAPPAELSLFARAVGVITAPRATMERIVAVPRPVGVLFLVALVVALAAATPMFTAAGQQAALDNVVQARIDAGRPMSPEEISGMERFAPYFGYFTVAQIFIGLPIISLIIAALCWVIFNTILGGTASFKQVLAVVTHSQVIGAVGAVIGAPIQMMQSKFTAGGPFNLGALAPMLDEKSALARLLGATSVFTIWGLIVTGIGLAVLYRRKPGNVAIGLIVAYLLIAFALISAFSGGGTTGR